MGWGPADVRPSFGTAAVAFVAFVVYEMRVAASPMADLHLFGDAASRQRVRGIRYLASGHRNDHYLSLYIQNTLGYSPVQSGLRFVPLFWSPSRVAFVTGRLSARCAMRVLLGVAMIAAAAGWPRWPA